MVSRLPSLGGSTEARRVTLRALMTRRDSVLAEKRRSQLQERDSSGYIYDDPATVRVIVGFIAGLNGIRTHRVGDLYNR